MPSVASSEKAPAGARIDFIDTLRGLAVLMVLWDHLVGIYLDKSHQTWWLHGWVSRYVNEPLGIIQNFGWLGVSLFFLVSGYVITHVAQRETRAQFGIRRVFRIYPPVFAAIFLALLFAMLSGSAAPHDWREMLAALTLFNYFLVPQKIILGVGWTLVIEVLFYIGVALQMTWLKRWPWLAVVSSLLSCALFIAVSRRFGDNFFLFAASVAYLPYLIVGQIIYLHSREMCSLGFAVAAGISSLLTIEYGLREIHFSFLPLENSYLISFVYAIFLFLVGMLTNRRPGGPILFCAKISYSIYLVHGPVGFATLEFGQRLGLPYPVSLAAALAAVFAAATLFHRLIELPAQWLGRRFTQFVGARRHAPETATAA